MPNFRPEHHLVQLGLFTLLLITAICLTIVREIDRPNQGFIETSVAFLTVLGTIVVFLGALTVVVTEIPMVLIEKYWRQRFSAGYDKGFEASERQWEAWNERRRAAETKGEPFPEPRPSSQANGEHPTPS